MRTKGKLFGAGLVGLVALAGTCSALPHFNRDTYGVKVVGSERVWQPKHPSKYVVFTIDSETGEPRTFENTDSFLEMKFNSSDVQASLMAAKEAQAPVEIRAYGFRVPFFSAYKNIVAVKKLDE